MVNCCVFVVCVLGDYLLFVFSCIVLGVLGGIYFLGFGCGRVFYVKLNLSCCC